MKLRHILIVVFAPVFILTLVVFIVSKWAPLVLPESVYSDLLLIGVIVSGASTLLAAIKDIIELVEKIISYRAKTRGTDLATIISQSRLASRNKRNREIMLKKVQSFWVEGVLENSLHGAVLLQLGMEREPDLVDHPWDTILQRPHQTDQILPKGTRIIDVYDAFGAAFLILGEPGSGKTTALLELTRDLIARAEEDDDHPIPIVLNLSSWAENWKGIEDWLIDELNSKYHVPNYVAQIWIQGDDLLLLLDGLDEVKEEWRDACVQAINQFRSEHMVNLVVCSRTNDYKALTNKLVLPGAISQKPLTVKQIDKYLRILGRELKAVRRAVRTDVTLQQLARSPLVLSIIALAYQGMDLDDLSPGTLEEQRDHLFTTYVNRMFEHRKVTGRYTPRQTIRRLIWLAKLMGNRVQTVFHMEQLQPDALSRVFLRKVFARCVELTIWLFIALPVGLACGLAMHYVADSLAYGVTTGFSFCLVSGLGMWIALTGRYQLRYRLLLGIVTGWAMSLMAWIFTQNPVVSLILGSAVGAATVFMYGRVGAKASIASSNPILEINTTRKRLGWSWYTGWVGFIKRLPLGIVFGLAGGVTAGFVFGWELALAVGIAFSLTLAVAGAMSYGMIDVNIEPLSKPNEGIWRSLQNAVRFGLVSGLWLGVVFGYLIGLLTNPENGFVVGFSFFVAGFMISGIIAGGLSVIQHSILRLLLSYSEDVPLRYADFLNHAVYHIFLRRVGSGYIFIHRLLLEYFASKALD